MAKTTPSFGEFLSELAQRAAPATADTLTALKVKMEAEKQAQIEAKLRLVFRQIEQGVDRLRDLRRREDAVKKEIKSFEELANKIVAGEDV